MSLRPTESMKNCHIVIYIAVSGHDVGWHLNLRVFKPKTTGARSARLRGAVALSKGPQKLLVVDYRHTGWKIPDWNKRREFAVRSVVFLKSQESYQNH